MFLVLSLLFSWFDKHNQLKEHKNKIEKKKRKTERQRTTTSNMASNTIVGLVYVTGV